MTRGSFYQQKGKRILDLGLTVPALIVLSPLLALVGLVVKRETPGPAIFRQDRLGLNGTVFQVCKFRTMVVGAGDGAVKSLHADPRVTRVGAFLRKTSLDELPQLWNVLRGDMSLIGPRPNRTFQMPHSEYQKQRFNVRPGITGLAQVSGRNAISWEQRYEIDIFYISKLSIWLDLIILAQTVVVILSGKGVESP
jgi:undecaprenyl phosphate N,N'-diacetylbacillosamine 1-phosphate transferase